MRFRPCCCAVASTLLSMAKSLAPSLVRNSTDLFIFSFSMRRSRSAGCKRHPEVVHEPRQELFPLAQVHTGLWPGRRLLWPVQPSSLGSPGDTPALPAAIGRSDAQSPGSAIWQLHPSARAIALPNWPASAAIAASRPLLLAGVHQRLQLAQLMRVARRVPLLGAIPHDPLLNDTLLLARSGCFKVGDLKSVEADGPVTLASFARSLDRHPDRTVVQSLDDRIGCEALIE